MKKTPLMVVIALCALLVGCKVNINSVIQHATDLRERYCSAADSDQKVEALHRLLVLLASTKVDVPQDGVCDSRFDLAIDMARQRAAAATE